MKNKLILSIFMVLFISAMALSQTIKPPTIYTPTDNEVILIPQGSTTTNVTLSYFNGFSPGAYGYRFDIYLNYDFYATTYDGSINLSSLSAGNHSVKVDLCMPVFSLQSNWGAVYSEYRNFSVIGPLTISGPTIATSPCQNLTFTANCPGIQYPEVIWDLWTTNNGWVTDLDIANSFGVFVCNPPLKVRARIYLNGVYVESNVITIQ